MDQLGAVGVTPAQRSCKVSTFIGSVVNRTSTLVVNAQLRARPGRPLGFLHERRFWKAITRRRPSIAHVRGSLSGGICQAFRLPAENGRCFAIPALTVNQQANPLTHGAAAQ